MPGSAAAPIESSALAATARGTRPWTRAKRSGPAAVRGLQPAEAAGGGEADVGVAVVQRLQERHLGERAAHVAEQGGVLGAAVGAGIGEACG